MSDILPENTSGCVGAAMPERVSDAGARRTVLAREGADQIDAGKLASTKARAACPPLTGEPKLAINVPEHRWRLRANAGERSYLQLTLARARSSRQIARKSRKAVIIRGLR